MSFKNNKIKHESDDEYILCLDCIGFGTCLDEPYDKSEFPRNNEFKSHTCTVCNGTGRVKKK